MKSHINKRKKRFAEAKRQERAENIKTKNPVKDEDIEQYASMMKRGVPPRIGRGRPRTVYSLSTLAVKLC